ncbi:hypothetical protein BASA81_009574 [Batrachochytrium salamandrivorans]|nr:hypothetical protein BASA81_009574 [Batrachochytrium salamandrivorans]
MSEDTSYRLVYILAVACLFQGISIMGFNYIAEQTYHWTRGFFRNSIGSAKMCQLKAQILDIKTQLSRTSAQDQFAKWAKLQRQHDKLVAEYTTKSNDANAYKIVFQMQVSWGLWALFWILQIGFLMFWRSEAMFYMPRDWVGPFSNWLSFPFAPKGSVSVLIGFMRVAAFVEDRSNFL